MRVACPNCSAEYDLPPAVAARLDGARTVRCARCGTTWAPPSPVSGSPPPAPEPTPVAPSPAPIPATPISATPISAPLVSAPPISTTPISTTPPLPEVPPPPVSTATPPAPAARPASPPPRAVANDGPRIALAWTLSLVLLAAAAWAAWHYRAEVMAAWPPSIRAYAALGLVP